MKMNGNRQNSVNLLNFELNINNSAKEHVRKKSNDAINNFFL